LLELRGSGDDTDSEPEVCEDLDEPPPGGGPNNNEEKSDEAR